MTGTPLLIKLKDKKEALEKDVVLKEKKHTVIL